MKKKQLNKHSWDQIHCSVYLLFSISFSSSSTALLLHAIVPSPFSAACLFFTVTLLWKGQMDDLHILTVKMNYQPYQITLVPFYESAFKYNVFSLLSFALLSAQ